MQVAVEKGKAVGFCLMTKPYSLPILASNLDRYFFNSTASLIKCAPDPMLKSVISWEKSN